MTATARVRDLAPAEIAERLDDLASLRIRVFRDWPYLYDGDRAYEAEYLKPYTESEHALVVGAFDGDALVGASTAAPMEDHADEFGAALDAAGLDPREIYYCGESVLLPEYRGQGIGVAFFEHREAKGRALGRAYSVFCSVIRPADHPLKPADYVPLDGFWRKRGYAVVDGAEARYAWKDVGEDAETEKAMRVWLKRL
ncbi:MAG: GNAT family N-acetyltransferase [Paracoccaceae bacterium]